MNTSIDELTVEPGKDYLLLRSQAAGYDLELEITADETRTLISKLEAGLAQLETGIDVGSEGAQPYERVESECG